MKIEPVSKIYTKPLPAFNGNISKNMTKYIDNAVINEVKKIVEKANTETVNTDEIIKIKNFGDYVKNIFSEYLAKFNKYTVLDIEFVDNKTLLSFKNNKFSPNHNIQINYSISQTEPFVKQDEILLTEPLKLNEKKLSNMKDLKNLHQAAKSLFKIKHKFIDRYFLMNAHEILEIKGQNISTPTQKFKIRNLAKNIDKFAKQIGEDTIAKSKIEEYIKKG